MKMKMLLFWTVSLMSVMTLVTQALSEEAPPANAHDISIGDYVVFLNTVASQGDDHELYNVASLGKEIVAQEDFLHFRKRARIFYVAVEGVNLASPLFGLTEQQAMRYCNWVENRCHIGALGTLLITEKGSYDLTQGEVIVNEAAQHHIAPDVLHPGCFVILVVDEN